MAFSGSDFEDLRRRLEAAELRAQRAEEGAQKAEVDKQKAEADAQNAEADKQKAEADKQKAEADKQKAEERAIRAEEERNQTNTTFQEYLDLCHIHFSKRLSVQFDISFSTKGTVTSPKGRCYPKKLLPWEGFDEGQRRRFDEVYEFFHSSSASPRLFSSSRTLEELGDMLCDRKFASEDDLRPHQQLSIEKPISTIIAALSEMEGAHKRFSLGRGVMFENHANTLDEQVEEVQQHLEAQALSNTDTVALTLVRADRICVYKDMEDRNSLSYLIEYKPPHKLPKWDLENGLRPMNLDREVVREYRIPIDTVKRKRYHADKKVGSVITQTFDYMIKSGLEYSYISTGKSFIFLRVDEADPTTVFYRLITPDEKKHVATDPKRNAFHTALGQVLSFSLLAFMSTRRGQDWCNRWIQKLPKWPIDGEGILPETPDNSKRSKTPQTSEFKGKPSNESRTFNLRARRTRQSKCNEDQPSAYIDSGDDSSSEPEPRWPETPVPVTHSTPTPAQTASMNSPVSSRTRGQTREYCTQACLLGLVRRSALDESCPNALIHGNGKPCRRHRINGKTFLTLVRKQLGRTLDQDCEPLWKQGARGNLFKITLASHGYTFVGKGTISAFIPYLQHEGRMYQRLERLQGQVVPVYLGNIGLVKPYWMDLGVEIVHMLLMSWGGETSQSSGALDLKGEVHRSVEEVRQEGVEHNDVREPNILWNDERQRAMLVDFERSRLLPDRLQPLQELSSNLKRKRCLVKVGDRGRG
ncbi:hypothetical protein GX50_03984 [[Emmonsia] crescens]|uniref:Protein kinase domain-containing protein n=1 Tax=[Emmonsia] crescens TaxID=73230 RepID=A0A2B7ZJN7_9EURO|nr:hypothetical protein GX50_03984 [Emmonsia crescens]